MKNKYHYMERLGLNENDNKIDYDVGVFQIKLSPWEQEIHIICNDKWKSDIPHISEIIIYAWECEESQLNFIEEGDIKIKIKYNFKNLNLFLSHLITI